ncbi:alpha/beta hydrolase [Uliginosibacterium gangwonense]|uniref:alpha/beta hydrolase n=1 Tax=Uliginosibacterium gangwonense TaxID=392736 RepID=UPI000370E899|nr:alpha/beta hydrolase [Uliginosibacterium gangwonense]
MTIAATPSTQEIRLWPAKAPGSLSDDTEPKLVHSPDGRLISSIHTPSMEMYRPAKPNGTGILILAGGAYTKLVYDKEGVEFAQWLNGMGITAFVLKYRLPCEGHIDGHLVPMQDAQRALRILRSRANELGLNPSRIGVLGASSGGHLAASLATNFARSTYAPVDAHDALSTRPDFLIALYGAYTGNRFFTHASQEQLFFPEPEKTRLYAEFPTHEQVSADTPTSFLVASEDDTQVSPENSTAFYLALRRAGVSAELHIFHDGGHGFALRRAAPQCIAAWPTLCANWLQSHQFLAEQQKS